jgi:hypothetical protein
MPDFNMGDIRQTQYPPDILTLQTKKFNEFN